MANWVASLNVGSGLTPNLTSFMGCIGAGDEGLKKQLGKYPWCVRSLK
jgi:hypothetical protein